MAAGETDHIKYLILATLPKARNHLSDDARVRLALSYDTDLKLQIDALRAELESLPEEELANRVAAHREMLRKASETRLKNEEASKWYNRRATKATYAHWAKMAHWTTDEAVALSLERDPRTVGWDQLKPLALVTPVAAKFAERREIAIRAVRARQLFPESTPGLFLAWAKRLQLDVPAELVDEVTALGVQIGDWKTLYDQMKAHKDELVAQYTSLLEMKDARLDEQRGQIASLTAAIDAKQSAEAAEDVKPRERDSMLRMIIAMAIRGYALNPRASRHGATQEIADDAVRVGLTIDPDTVRKYLYEGIALLPPKPNE